MKKTMIAMAVAGVVAAPIASADVSISGVIEQEFVDNEASGTGWTDDSFNMLNFKASEDLGNGMTAFAKWGFLDKEGRTGTMNGGDATVGLSGGFGTIVAGTQEDFTEGKAMSRMTLSGTAAGIEPNNSNATRTEGGLAYVSPTVSGFHVGAAGFIGKSTTGTENLDAVDLMAAYKNGGIDLIATMETQDKDGSMTTSGAADQETTVLGASYTTGNLKVGVLSVNEDNNEGVQDADSDDLMLRADYTMGNNKITLATLNDESSTVAGVKTDVDTTALELTHSLSSRTKAYVGFVDVETANSNKTYVGLQHSF